MNFDELSQQIEKLHLHLAALRQHINSGSEYQEFQTALEVLQSAFAGLMLAQKELAIARQTVENQTANQEYLELAQTSAKFGSFEWDLQSNVVTRSKELQALYGLKPGEFGQTYEDWTKHVHPDDLIQAENEFQKSLMTGKWCADFRVIWTDGSVHWLQVRAKVFFDAAGKPLRIVGVDEDITERKLAESALQESEQRYRILAESLPHLVWSAEAGGVVDYCNRHWCEYTGLTLEQSQGTGWLGALHPDDRQRTSECWRAAAKSGTSFSIEYRFMRADGVYHWFFARVTPYRDRDGRIVKWIGAATDIDKRKAAEERVLHAALYDALTDLPNRTLFMQRLQQAVEYAKRHKDFLFAVLFLDLDCFKFINDSLGHSFGDQFLLKIAERLEGCLRSVDVAARLGGDEFTILLEGIRDVSDAVHVAERVQQQLALPSTVDGQQLSTTVSIGIALSTTSYEQPEDLLRNADIAMYKAKAQGKARYEIFSTDMHIQVVERLQLERDLRGNNGTTDTSANYEM